MNALNFSKEDLFSFIEKNKSYQYIIVVFTTEWCKACKRMLGVLRQLLEERKEKDILFLPIDAEKNLALSKDPFFAVSVVPKTFIFQKGAFWRKVEGSVDLDSLKGLFQ